MPTIKANEKQLSALKDIENALKIVSDINAIFSTHSDVCVSCKEGKGRATKEYSVVLDDGTKKKVLTALNAVKDRLGKDAMAKAARYNVSLSDDELAIFAACGENTNTEPEGGTDTAEGMDEPSIPDAKETADAGAEDAAQDGGADSGSESAAGYYQSSP